MRRFFNQLYRSFNYTLLSALIVVNPSFKDKKVSQFLFGNNIEYVYEKEFSDIQDKITQMSKGVVTALRFPGGGLSDEYSWLDGVGAKVGRELTKNKWGKLYDNSLGTDEIVEFCRTIDAEPFLTVNFKTGTPQEAKAWVQYCNSEVLANKYSQVESKKSFKILRDTKVFSKIPEDYFPNLRNSNGYKEPFNVKFWEIGNEIYFDSTISSTDYATRLIEYSRLMRSVSKDINIGANFNNSNLEWNKPLMNIAKDYFDFISIHFYDGPSSSPLRFIWYSNAVVEKEIEISKSGRYSVIFEAAGTDFMGYPELEIKVNGMSIKQLPVGTKEFAVYRVPIDITAGTRKFSFGFINDLCAGKGKDRNLFIRNIAIEGQGIKQLVFDENDEYYLLFLANSNVEGKIRQINNYLASFGFTGKIAVTEGNVRYGLAGVFDREQTKQGVKLKSALFVAGYLNSFIREGIWMYNYWNLLTSGYYGLFRPDGHVIPSYFVMKMYAQYLGEEVLELNIESPLFVNKSLNPGSNNQRVPYLDAVATSSKERNKISIMVINRHPNNTLETTIDLQKFNIDTTIPVIVRTLSDSDGKGMEADNEKNPNNVSIHETNVTINSDKFQFNFSPHSVTNLELSLRSS